MLIPIGILAVAGAGAGAAGSYELIETALVGSGGQASVTFSNLSQYSSTYQHLQIRATIRSTRNLANDEFYFGFNGDTAWGTTYKGHRLWGNGSSVQSGNTGTIYAADVPGATAAASAFAGVVIDILDPYETTKNKTIRELFGSSANNTIMLTSGVWLNTNAVSAINFYLSSANFAEFSRFSLYGLRGTI